MLIPSRDKQKLVLISQ